MRSRCLMACVVLLALMPLSEARACSQCMCGTPFPEYALGGVVPMQIRYGLEDRYLSKSNALEEEPGQEREREHRISAFAVWRPADRIALLGRLPWNVKEIEEKPVGGEAVTRSERGLGDAEAAALIGVARTNGPHAAMVGLFLGVTAPTGSNDRRDENGARLDEHLQPGSGAWSGSGGWNVALALGDGILDASALGRANGKNDHGYRYGNVLLYNLGYASPARAGWQLLAQINGRSAARDRLEDGARGVNTGGTAVYVSPGLRWQTAVGLGIEAAAQIPVYESLFGDQDEHVTGRLALSLSR